MANEKYTVVGDTQLDNETASRVANVVVTGLREMLNADGTFKDAATQAEFEKFCLARKC